MTGFRLKKSLLVSNPRSFWPQIGDFARQPGLYPAHVCQTCGHIKLVTPACLPDLPALQACYPGMSGRFTGTTSLLPRHVWQICRHNKLATPACLPDLRAHQACHPGMSGRFAGTTSLLPWHVCQICGHTKMGTRACLADSWAWQDGCPPESVGFVGAPGWVPAQNRRFSGCLEVFSPRIRSSWPQKSAGNATFVILAFLGG